MAQIFKTISLEDRLRSSIYNQLPQQPQPVNQGEGRVNLPTTPSFSNAAQLKITIDARDKNAAILKDLARSTGAQILPNINLSEQTGLTRFNIPQANTKFRTTISLADRLAQTGLGTTVHLPQFFLADFYANYITISPFGIFNHTSTIIVPQSGPTPNQGGLLPINITFVPNHTSNIQPPIPIADYILLQGGVFSNGIYTSIAPITFTPEDFILRQGVVLINGNFRSLINISLPTQDVILRQGAVVVNGLFESLIDPSDPTPVGFVLQGYGVTPTQAISIQAVYPLQGVVVSLNTLQSGIIPATPIATPDQGGLDPTPITFEPDRSSPILRVLFYAAQRALAFFTPRVVHGSADLRNENFARRNLYYGSTIDVDGILDGINSQSRKFISPELRVYARRLKVGSEAPNSELYPEGGRVPALEYTYEDVGIKNEVELSSGGIYPNYRSDLFNNRNRAGIALNTTADEETLEKLQDEVDFIYQSDRYNPNRLPGVSWPVEQGVVGSLAQYRTLAYDQMADRSKKAASGESQPDYRSELRVEVTGADGNAVRGSGVDPESEVNYNELGGGNYPELRSGGQVQSGVNSGTYNTLGYKQILDRAAVGKQNVLQDDYRSQLTFGSIGGDGNPVGPQGIKQDSVIKYDDLGQLGYGLGRVYDEVRTGKDSLLPSVAKYGTLGYEDIVSRINQKLTTDGGNDFRLTTRRGIKGTNDGVGKSVNNRSGFTNGEVTGDVSDDLINLVVGRQQFRAFVTSFSDGFTINWNDINYVGRQDTMKAFKGVTRGGSLGFKVAAFNPQDLKIQYGKLNSLIRNVAIGSAATGTIDPSVNKYIIGPVTKLTVGNWLVDADVVMGSLKFDIQTAEYPWEIANGKQVPQVVDVSLDFTVLGDADGNPLPGSNIYLEYS